MIHTIDVNEIKRVVEAQKNFCAVVEHFSRYVETLIQENEQVATLT